MNDLDKAKEHQRIINAYHSVFNTDAGKIVLRDIKKRFRTSLPAFLPKKEGDEIYGYDPIQAALRDGQRSVELYIEFMCSEPFQGDGNIEQPTTRIIK